MNPGRKYLSFSLLKLSQTTCHNRLPANLILTHIFVDCHYVIIPLSGMIISVTKTECCAIFS